MFTKLSSTATVLLALATWATGQEPAFPTRASGSERASPANGQDREPLVRASSQGRRPAPASEARPDDPGGPGGPGGPGPQAGPGPAGGGPWPPLPPLDPGLFCPPWIADQAVPMGALPASVVPALGALFPLGRDLFVDSLGNVGIGTFTPAARLHVEGGDLNVREGALRVRASGPDELELGTSAAEPRPHLIDGFTTILGGASPEASFATGDYRLSTGDAVLGAVLETGVAGGGTMSRLHAAGPRGAGLELDVGGQGHVFEAHVGAGAGRWEVTADGLSGSTRFDGGAFDGDGGFQVRDPSGNTVIDLDATDDLLLAGAELNMYSDQSQRVVNAAGDSLGGGGLAVSGGSSGASVGGGNSLGGEGGFGMWNQGYGNFSLNALSPTQGSELRQTDSQVRDTVFAQASNSAAESPVFLRLQNHADGPGSSFTGAELRPPAKSKSSVLELRANNGGGITLLGQSDAGDQGGGISIRQNGMTRFELYDNRMTLFDAGGTATVHYDGVTGEKMAIVQTSAGARSVYCSEAAEVWFEDAGVARLEDGVAEVLLDPVFLQTVCVDEAHPPHVAASSRGSSPGVWVEKHLDRLVLHELPGGTGDGLVDWRVQARRRGLEQARLEPYVSAR